MGSRCKFAHGENELERYQRIESEYNKSHYDRRYNDKYKSDYHQYDDKYESKYYHIKKPSRISHVHHYSVHNYDNDKRPYVNLPLSSRSYKEKSPNLCNEKVDVVEEGEFVNLKMSSKHRAQALSPLQSPSPKQRKLSDNKSDNAFDDDTKLPRTIVEVCEENQQGIRSGSNLEDILCLPPKDLETNMQDNCNEVEHKAKLCASCEKINICLHQTLKENSTLKNAMCILHKKYSQMKEAKSNYIESIKNIESLVFPH